ncbi:MAG: hypothetical protein SPL12_06515, partial [Bacteroidales bacterium]|nr:hypothetical protein [Bacteroidales bacterium]
SWGTFLTPDDMLLVYSIHIQAKAKMLTPPVLEFWRNFNEGTILQCHFLLTLSLSKADAKIRIKIGLAKYFFLPARFSLDFLVFLVF